jgi:CheY-like chemotaxis protein
MRAARAADLARIVLFHWEGREAAERCARLARDGIAATHRTRGGLSFRDIRENPPDAVVIDLTRMPSYGRTVGVVMREQKSLRGIPIIFIEGDPEKTALAREQVPGSEFTTWPRLAEALERIQRRGPTEAPPARPPRRATAEKLRIRVGSTVALLHAPEGTETKLRPLPARARVQKKIGEADVILAFVRSPAEARYELTKLKPHLRPGRAVWVMWPKKASGRGSGLAMPMLRQIAMSIGLVDNKVCAFDETWAGMALARRQLAERE